MGVLETIPFVRSVTERFRRGTPTSAQHNDFRRFAVLAGWGGQNPSVGRHDPHRALDAEECAAIYDFLKQKGWLPDPAATAETVVASCLEMKATKAYSDCILGSTLPEEAERCQ